MRYFLSLVLAMFLVAPVMAAEKVAEKAVEKVGKKAVEKVVESADEANPRGGFEGPVSGAQAENVAAAKKLPQDGRVVLTGNIVSRVVGENNEYMFKDGTGEIQVRITPKQFRDNKVTPVTKVQIVGKIDKSANSPDSARLKATSLEVLK